MRALTATIALLALAGTAGATTPSDRPGFFRELGKDFAHVVAPSNLVVFGAGGAAALLVYPQDHQITEDFVASARLDSFLRFGNVAGNGFTQGGLAVATWLVGKASHSKGIAEVGEDLIRAQIVNGTLTASLKLAAHRERPDGTPWSFPSGHASASFATATVLQRHLGWKVGLPAYAAAAYIGASRLQDNKHFASDVLFGAAVGIVSGRAVTFDRGRTHVTLAPLAVPGGGGLALVGTSR
jgi:membrane-associated phospholipid phosphatase